MRLLVAIRPLILALAETSIVLALGCRPETPADRVADTAPVPVHVCRAERRPLRPTLTLVGTLVAIPEQSASVSPRAGGWIREVPVTEGATVAAGAPLIRLDCRVAEVNCEKARAALLEKQAILLRLRHGPRPEELDVARADQEQAAARARGLRKQWDAATTLHARQEMSDVRYATLGADMQAADAAARAAAAQVKLLEAGTRAEEIAQAEAQVAAARAELKDAELALRFCTIDSPIGGRVTQLFARAGMYAERAVVLATVTDLSAVFANVRIPNAWQSKVTGPVTAVVTASAVPGVTFPGRLARRSGQADPATGDMQAFVRVTNGKGFLHPGFACQVRLVLPVLPDALAVPAEAVADRAGVPVLTIVRDNRAHEVDVQLGVKTEDFVQITGGLAAGDLVVTRGGYGLPAGCPVRIVAGTAARSPESPPEP